MRPARAGRFLRTAAALCTVALLWGCARRGPAAASAEELLPALPQAAVSTAPLGQLGAHALALLARGARLQGGEQLEEARRAIPFQLGFDPLTREGLAQAGLDSERGAAFALLPGSGRPGWIAALPLKNEEAFARQVDRLARERSGFPERREEERSGVKATVFSRPGRSDRLAHAVVRGWALVAHGEAPLDAIVAAAARPAEESLARAGSWTSARELRASDLFLFGPKGSALPERLLRRALPGDVSLALSGDANGLRARLFVQLDEAGAREAQELLPGGGAELMRRLPGNAPLLLRLGVAPAQLPAQLARIGALKERLAALRAELAKKGVDLDRDLFAALKPGAVLSLGLSPRADLGRAAEPAALDLRARSPFELVQLLALAEASDPPRLQRALTSVAAALPALGTQVTAVPGGYRVRYAGGEGPSFGTWKAKDRDAVIAYVLGGTSPEDLPALAPAATAAPAASVTLQIDLGKLATQVQAMPSSAYGSGPQSYVARSLVQQVIEPLRPLVVRGSLAPEARGLVAELSIDLGPSEKTP